MNPGGKLPDGLLLSVAGARGVVGEGIDVVTVARLAAAFSSVLSPGPVVVGRDTRPSGRAFGLACIASLLASGRDCMDLDVATTPTIEMAVTNLEAAGGIVISASHNPVQWNALKFLDERGVFIGPEKAVRLREALASPPRCVEPAGFGRAVRYTRASRDHVDAILSLPLIDRDRIARRRFDVVLDCTNGAGSVIAPLLLDELGVRVTKIDCKRNGDFRRDPEPRPENLKRLARKVADTGADLGFALDPDADRLALVDARLGALSEEYTLIAAVDYVLSKNPGDVVINMSTSEAVDKVASRYGVAVTRTPVGEAHVVAEMMRRGSPIGGEGNGGVILPALHPGRDGILAMALILQFLSEEGAGLYDIVSAYPRFSMIKLKIPLEGEFDSDRISDIIRKKGPKTLDGRDGVRAGFEDGWFHIRVSNTEGVVRVIAEAADGERAERLAREAIEILRRSWLR